MGKRQTELTWSQVYEVVDKHRKSIPMSWEQVREAGGPSETTMRKMRDGTPLVEETTRTALCRAIGWEPGSIERVLAGHGPILTPQSAPGIDAEVREAIALLGETVSEVRDLQRSRSAQFDSLDERVGRIERALGLEPPEH